MEKWKDIPNFENYYEVSNLGRFRSKIRIVNRNNSVYTRKQIYLKYSLTKAGYPRLRLIVDKKQTKLLCHRIMAICFIENPKNYAFVNHIDGNKENFIIENLEWCSHLQNMQHAFETGLANGAPVKSISQYSKDKVFIKKFNSITDACESLGIPEASSNIVKCAKGKLSSAYGFIWKY